MKLLDPLMNGVFRGLLKMFFKFDASPLQTVQAEGPLIITANHTHALDGPLLYVFMRPRNMVAMAKKELWDIPFTRFIMNRWKSIPVDRDAMGRETMNACFAVLKNNNILAIAPEGTRSKSGVLQEGKSGVAYIAYREKAPIIPIVTLGFDGFRENIRRLRRTPLLVKVGTPYEIVEQPGRLDGAGREALMDEIMIRLAALLPEEKRGRYGIKDPSFVYTRDITS